MSIGAFLSNFVDVCMDVLNLSEFAREKAVWRYLLNADLTRKAYNDHKDVFRFRDRVVYDDQHGERYTLFQVSSDEKFFDLFGLTGYQQEKKKVVSDRTREGEELAAIQMSQLAETYHIPVSPYYRMAS